MRTWRATYRGFVPDDYLSALDPVRWRPFWQDRLRTPEGRAGVLVLLPDPGDRPVGFAIFGRSRDPAVADLGHEASGGGDSGRVGSGREASGGGDSGRAGSDRNAFGGDGSGDGSGRDGSGGDGSAGGDGSGGAGSGRDGCGGDGSAGGGGSGGAGSERDGSDGDDSGRDGVAGGASGGVGEIFAIYVLPAHQGGGGGRLLISGALRALAADGCDRATLWVLEGNAAARRFYEHGGWHPDGSTKRDESRGFPLDEIRYARHLP
ncbi:GNAT superfamily N-acetyltransferase [Catenuloplanes nepalensis]|uniref:GNAT superfamily N-acetyltransferase n=1 Tax=Catenuloplanes nepalensis TaxID=587533 RepID=A0ABT9MVV4_9ACTN|nr:GNAT family N-acetyltransferase [Catenuloplanes nepalensis]MDP9795363.1 GNAT superfamily N-acetyltransferase [Catenuloplanes nepalensis]